MIKELRIQFLAVVEDVTLELDDGLNVLTGSTGAGKSLILSAVNFLLGERATARVIRKGEEKAVVEGVFHLAAPLALPGIAAESGTSRLVLRREIFRSGRSFAFLDGRPCTLRNLQEIARRLIEPHGQNEQFKLRFPENHVFYVDALAKNGALVEAYREALHAFKESDSALQAFERRVALAKEKEELLRHRIDEIERARVKPGEKTALEAALKVLENAQAIYDALSHAGGAIYEDDGSAAGLISQGRKRLARLSGIDPKIDAIAAQLETAEITLKECAEEMRAYLDGVEFDPQKLEAMQERLAYLQGLERRYGKPIDGILEEKDAWRKELDTITFEEEERSKRVVERKGRLEALEKRGAALSESRRKAAKDLDRCLTEALGGLMMAGARFRTGFAGGVDTDAGPAADGEDFRFGENGIDHVEFFVRTNRGEAEGSLCEIASSGEISRIALALKSIVSTGPEGSVLVFDEVDAGVGADLGETIADKLLALAARYQIICITHLPQVAARGRRHLVVHKRSAGGRTYAEVRAVDGDERLHEIARMLGGREGSAKRLALAEELLAARKKHGISHTVRP